MASRGNRDDEGESGEETDDEDYAPDDEESEEEYEEAEAAAAESPEIELLVVPAGGGDGDEDEEVVMVSETRGIGRGLECEESNSGTEEQLQAGSEPSCLPCCPICLVPWTPDGFHRVCCIPCGHVYGRSCLESWIKRCKKNAAKCPLCSARFKQTEMINLYAPLIAVTKTDLEKEVLSLREKNESLKLEGRAQMDEEEEEQPIESRRASVSAGPSSNNWGERLDHLEWEIARIRRKQSRIQREMQHFAHHMNAGFDYLRQTQQQNFQYQNQMNAFFAAMSDGWSMQGGPTHPEWPQPPTYPAPPSPYQELGPDDDDDDDDDDD